MGTLRRISNWLLAITAQQIVVKVVALVPFSYVTTWITNTIYKGEWWSAADLPPGFWLVLSILSAPVLIYNGYVKPWTRSRRRKHERLQRREQQERKNERNIINEAFERLEFVLHPEVLDPDHPGNPAYMRKQARDAVDSVLKQFNAKNISSPGLINVNSNSDLATWHEFLRKARICFPTAEASASNSPTTTSSGRQVRTTESRVNEDSGTQHEAHWGLFFRETWRKISSKFRNEPFNERS